ncbi:MAG: hypothetical protein K2J90_08840 [Lachnospiraceae bacterium]|nr:hypothetical protein [Lachnospiraceae bacterium]
MLKRFFSLSLLILCGILLTGCNTVRDLSEDETRLIAEYAASVLLKYDINYTDRIDEGDKVLEDKKSEESGEQSTQEEVTTQEDTSEAPEADNENAGKEKDTDSAASVGTESDIAKIAGIDGVSITYKDYLLTKEYPTGEENDEAVALETEEGHQLLVLRFKVACTSESPVDIALLDKAIEYQVICNGNLAAQPMLTILTEDLGTFDMTVQPDKEENAVLVFQIADEVKEKLETIDLKIHYNGTDNMITILK